MQNRPAAILGSTIGTSPVPQGTTASQPTEHFGATRSGIVSCDRHGTQQVTEIRLSDGWHSPKCPSCEAEELSRRAEAEAVRQGRLDARRKQTSVEQRLKRADIPPRFAERSFEAFHGETEEQRRALRIARAYAKGFDDARRVGKSMILYGKLGTGKTHLACAILNHVATHHGAEARYLSFAKAIRSVKQTYAKSSAMTEQQALDALAVPDLLVLDEVGVQFGSETEKIIGFEIINTRYEAMKPTIVLSNLAFEELRECLGDRVIDRLRENGGKLIEFTGESQRGLPLARGRVLDSFSPIG